MQARKNLENCIANEIHKKLSEKLGEVQIAFEDWCPDFGLLPHPSGESTIERLPYGQFQGAKNPKELNFVSPERMPIPIWHWQAPLCVGSKESRIKLNQIHPLQEMDMRP